LVAPFRSSSFDLLIGNYEKIMRDGAFYFTTTEDFGLDADRAFLFLRFLRRKEAEEIRDIFLQQ